MAICGFFEIEIKNIRKWKKQFGQLKKKMAV